MPIYCHDLGRLYHLSNFDSLKEYYFPFYTISFENASLFVQFYASTGVNKQAKGTTDQCIEYIKSIGPFTTFVQTSVSSSHNLANI